jgi:hypothetical protein
MGRLSLLNSVHLSLRLYKIPRAWSIVLFCHFRKRTVQVQSETGSGATTMKHRLRTVSHTRYGAIVTKYRSMVLKVKYCR